MDSNPGSPALPAPSTSVRVSLLRKVDFEEFQRATERFGTAGVQPALLRALFDRYNTDNSVGLSYSEFSRGLLGTGSQFDFAQQGRSPLLLAPRPRGPLATVPLPEI